MSANSTALLHNMSSAPKTVIRHEGALPAGTREVVFELAPLDTLDSAQDSPLGAFLSDEQRRSLPDLQKQARQILRNHARKMPYPPAALVISEGIAPDAQMERDFLTVCTVLSKANDHVFLRDKEPNLDKVRFGRRIALLLPAPESGRQQ